MRHFGGNKLRILFYDPNDASVYYSETEINSVGGMLEAHYYKISDTLGLMTAGHIFAQT